MEKVTRNVLTHKKDELIRLLRNEYIDNGYLYSGSIPYNSLIDKGFSREAVDELLKEGIIQKRNCEGLAYELSANERKRLIAEYYLCSVWYEKNGEGLLLSIQNEVKDVATILGCGAEMTVNTTKNESGPAKMTVHSPFSVGQVIQLEYDLAQKQSAAVHADKVPRSGGVAIGKFMVTDVIANSLVSPPTNLIKLQSIDHTFNQIRPKARTILMFEDEVLDRMKEPSLDDKIKAVSKRAVAQTIADEKTKKFSPER